MSMWTAPRDADPSRSSTLNVRSVPAVTADSTLLTVLNQMNCSSRDLAHTLPGREGVLINRPYLTVLRWTDSMMCEVTVEDVNTGEQGKIFCEESGIKAWAGIMSGVFKVVHVEKTLRCYF